MPNWCSCNVTVKGPTAEVTKLAEQINSQIGNEQGGVCSVIAPQPPEEELDFGNDIMPGWYIWRVNNWGTKWDFEPLKEVVVFNLDDDRAEFVMDFDSAWSPPIQLFDTLVENGFDVTAYYNEPGMMFAGVYENGADETYCYEDSSSESVKDDLPENLVELFGIDDMLSEIEDDE